MVKYLFEISETPANLHYPILFSKKHDNGIATPKKAIAVQSMIDALNELYSKHYTLDDDASYFDTQKVENQFVASQLPFGTIHYQTGKVINNDGLSVERIAVVVPKDIYPASYLGKPVMLGFPTSLFLLTFTKDNKNKRHLKAGNVFALKEKLHKVNDNTPFYTFPFPNVAKDSGKICWGNTAATIKGDTLSEFVQNAIDTFITANFGNDYGIAMDSKKYGNFGDYVEDMDNKPFDDNSLIPSLVGNLNELFIKLKA